MHSHLVTIEVGVERGTYKWICLLYTSSFYQLDDESRQEVVETIRLKLQYHRDPERAEQIKQIKGW